MRIKNLSLRKLIKYILHNKDQSKVNEYPSTSIIVNASNEIVDHFFIKDNFWRHK